MGLVFERVGCISEKQGDGDHVEVFERHGVVFFGFLFGFGEHVFVIEGNAVGDESTGGAGTNAHIDDGGDFPEFEDDAHSLGEENHPA